jgi:hypothetical protein
MPDCLRLFPDLDDQIAVSRSRSNNKLMRCPFRDVDNIADRNGLNDTVLNAAAPDFPITSSVRVNDGSTGDQCSLPLGHDHHVIEVSVDFPTPTRRSGVEAHCMAPKIRKGCGRAALRPGLIGQLSSCSCTSAAWKT